MKPVLCVIDVRNGATVQWSKLSVRGTPAIWVKSTSFLFIKQLTRSRLTGVAQSRASQGAYGMRKYISTTQIYLSTQSVMSIFCSVKMFPKPCEARYHPFDTPIDVVFWERKLD